MGNLQCGSKLAQPCLSDIDPRYSSTASADNLVDQSQTWEDMSGFWAPIKYDYLTNVTDTPSTRPPTLFNLTSNQGWPYTRDRFTGINRRILNGSRFVEQAILFYPPAPEEFCNNGEVPEGMANVVGVDPNDPTKTNAKCGINGNVFYQEVWYTSTYERNGRANVQWVTSGPVYSRSPGSPPLPGDSYREPIGEDASFQYVSYDIPGFPFTFGGTETFLSEDKKYAFGTGNSAIGLPVEEGGTGVIRNTYLYSVNKVDDETTFLEEVRKAYAANNIVEDEIPIWVTNGEPMPSCLISESGGSCPTDEYFCGVNGTDPGCTSSPYEEPIPAMKPGAVVGFIILGLAIAFVIGYAIHRYIVKKKQKKLRTLFAQQVTKRVDLRRSVSQLNPDNLAAEFTRIDQGLKNNKDGTADGFISKDELWDFVQSGKAGEMSKKDFDALFDAMDIKNRGKVNFVEFASFMAECAGEIREAAATAAADKNNNNDEIMNPNNNNDKSSKAMILRAASVRLSSMEFITTTPDDKPSKDESESPV